MREAQSRQKSYADSRRRKLEFSVGDFVFIRVSPMKGVVHFSRSGKLAPRYIDPFPITERVGSVAYRLLLPAQFSVIHDVFHASFFYGNALGIPIFILEPGVIVEIEVSPDLIYEQHSIRIIASEVERLRNKDVPLVKVQWSSNPKDCSWESREFIERTHPDLLSRALQGELLTLNFILC